MSEVPKGEEEAVVAVAAVALQSRDSCFVSSVLRVTR